MKNPTMLYKCPGPEVFEGVACETCVVEDEAVESAMSEGWHRNWMDAAAAKVKANEAEIAENAKKLKKAKA